MKETNDNINENKILLDNTIKPSAPITLNENLNESLLLEKQSCCKEFKNKICSIYFVFYFLIIIFIFGLYLMIYYLYFITNNEPNFSIKNRDWISPSIDNRSYEIYSFKNGLEVMLIQDKDFDRDGAAIVIEGGYLDNPEEEGISNYITHILSNYNFNDEINDINILKVYYGNFKFDDEGHFINFRFDILNNGFKQFFQLFSPILDIDKMNIDAFSEKNKTEIIEDMEKNFNQTQEYFPNKEKHLIEYLVYGFKNNITNEEILPEGNSEVLKNIDNSQIKNYLEKLIIPSKIKIVVFSKYKFSLSSKYMKRNFKYLIDKKNISETSKESNENEDKKFKKSQIIFMNVPDDLNFNYIKIIYYIDKVSNEDYSELFYKKSYFYYISDFLHKKKDGSLYNSIKNSIKSIETSINVILKEKIQFTIDLKLKSLKNINDIIYLTYQYIHKIINKTDETNIQKDRYEELKNICRSTQNLTENSYDTITMAKDNAIHLIESKYAQKYYYYFDCVPWNDSIDYKNYTESFLYNQTAPYLKQLKPENSIIILAIRDSDRQNLTCNNFSNFKLDCDYLLNESNFKETNYYKVKYNNMVFNSKELEETLIHDKDEFNIKFENNEFKSKYTNACTDSSEETNFKHIDFNNTKTLNNFYFKKSIKTCVQKVLLKLHLYHPFLRAKNDDIDKRQCYYFLVMEIFIAIKQKINEELSDAISANNEITFGRTENYLYILVSCFEDQANKIAAKIKEIIYTTNWKREGFFIDDINYLYKVETIDEFFHYDHTKIQDISRFFFERNFKHKFLFNYYEFFPKEFETKYKGCIHNVSESIMTTYLQNFAIEGYIYGYYNESDALSLSNLYNIPNIEEIRKLLKLVNITENDTDIFNYINWAKEITELKKNMTVNISEKVFNKSENGNYGISYRSFNESPLNISIFQNILRDFGLIEDSSLKNIEMVIYGKQFFELIFYNENKGVIIPNEELVVKEWNDLLNNREKIDELEKEIDNIGNRYYYMIKNYVDLLKKKQASLGERGFNEINLFDQNGKYLNNSKIIEEYNDQYKNILIDRKELQAKIDYLKKKLDSYKVDVFTFGA